MHDRLYDVLVIGGGNAGVCAALTARQAGASVLVLECAPRHFRGGNSRHTRNCRCAHREPTEILADSYRDEEFFADLLRVTANQTDEPLARMAIERSAECPAWMRQFGVRLQSSLRGTLHLGRTNAFFLGGGKALLNSYYAAAEQRGIEVEYDAEVVALDLRDGAFHSATVMNKSQAPVGRALSGSPYTVRAKAVVIAAGGFEANIDWLREIWGDAADNFIIRGTPYNTGTLLRLLLDAGAASVADPHACHSIALDARSPKFDGGIVTRLDCLPLGIVVNRAAERFYDEGEDLWPKRYAIWGALIARQPGQIAYSIFDSKVMGRFMPSVFPVIQAASIQELASALDLPGDALAATVARFNQAVRSGVFDHSILDDCRTQGLSPEKTHWAQRLDTPPFFAYPLRPGITFTYLGVKVDERARVLMQNGEPLGNVCAAGEIMAGNILRNGYLAGFGMTIGTVFGRIAGEEAAHHVKRT
jgi:tricarballylate dehydrogenase